MSSNIKRSDFFVRPVVPSSRQRKRMAVFVKLRTHVRRAKVRTRPLRSDTNFQSLSVFIFRISLGSVDGSVVGMGMASRSWDRRSRNTGRFFAGGTAGRWEVLAWNDAAHACSAAGGRLSHGVLTRPPG